MSNHIDNNQTVYTSGARIQPMQLANGKYAFVVMAFEDESFYDGEHVSLESTHKENIDLLFKVIGHQIVNKNSNEIAQEFHENEFQL